MAFPRAAVSSWRILAEIKPCRIRSKFDGPDPGFATATAPAVEEFFRIGWRALK